eukprot:scaffold26043_cov61-Phaeocystis_antarctica.AAC.5
MPPGFKAAGLRESPPLPPWKFGASNERDSEVPSIHVSTRANQGNKSRIIIAWKQSCSVPTDITSMCSLSRTKSMIASTPSSERNASKCSDQPHWGKVLIALGTHVKLSVSSSETATCDWRSAPSTSWLR